MDPEVPVLSVTELGIVREVAIDGERVTVTVTPTYSGCPAMQVIEDEILAALDDAGFHAAVVRTVYQPAWTTDWIPPEAREKLRAYGIAPPAATSSRRALFGDDGVACPRCGSERTQKISEFGSTACKSLWRCLACREPFDHFKCI
jgi:ring-1,2-phenylacetyl-CoA epoxidase subunit PaaD